MKITKDTTIKRVLEIPGSEQILAKYKVPCLTCPMAQYEIGALKLGDVCNVYGINLTALLKALNNAENQK